MASEFVFCEHCNMITSCILSSDTDCWIWTCTACGNEADSEEISDYEYEEYEDEDEDEELDDYFGNGDDY